MSKIQIWHNPRCTKSRKTLAMLEERGLSPEVVNYLDAPPPRAAIAKVASEVGLDRLVRRKEAAFKELGLQGASDDALLDALVAHPALIERPVVLTPKGVRLGRPPEDVLDIL